MQPSNSNFIKEDKCDECGTFASIWIIQDAIFIICQPPVIFIQ